MAVQATGLSNVPKVKTYRAQDGSVSEKLKYDVIGFGTDEIRQFMVKITAEETAAQIRLDNPPAFVNVDGVRGREVSSARRTTMVSFGMRLKVQALNALKAGLSAAIQHSTTTRTGMLSNMANWKWLYVREGRGQGLPVTGSSGIPMGPRDFIVLSPVNVRNKKDENYATAANMRVAGTGKLTFRRSAVGKPTKKNQSIGYLALAARAANASPMFDGFNVTAGFTARHALPKEVLRRFGVRSGFIMIRPMVGSGGRRKRG